MHGEIVKINVLSYYAKICSVSLSKRPIGYRQLAMN